MVSVIGYLVFGLTLHVIVSVNLLRVHKRQARIQSCYEIPKSFDLRDLGFKSPVKSQLEPETCASCWAISVLGSIEGLIFKYNGTLVHLSIQQLIDCDTSNVGCRGGTTRRAFNYIIDNGLQLESVYPYLAKDSVCKYDLNKLYIMISGYTEIQSGNETALTEAIYSHGAISASMHATKKFEAYTGGIFNDTDCKSELYFHNHALLIIGYGTTNDGIDYYIIKNSWGTNWGMGGYAYILRNRNNHCGLATNAYYPIINFQ